MTKISQELSGDLNNSSTSSGPFTESIEVPHTRIVLDMDMPEGLYHAPNRFQEGNATISYAVSFMPPEVQRIVMSYGLASSLFDKAQNMEHACSSLSRRAQVPDSHRALWREASEVCRRDEGYSYNPDKHPIPEDFKKSFVSNSRRVVTKGDLYKENNELRKRVDELEKRLQSMKVPPLSRSVSRKIK